MGGENPLPNTDQKIRSKSNSIISTDFESAIRQAGYGKFNWAMLLMSIPASWSASFVTGTMAYVIPVAVEDLGLTPTTKALMQSSHYVGMIISAFFWGGLCDSLGRQRLLAYGFLLDFVMNTCCALIPYLPSMLLFKFLSGCVICGPSAIFMAYISEVFSDKRREFAVLSAGIFSSIGSIVHVSLALVLIPLQVPEWLPLKSWQLFILSCGLPSLVTGICCAFTVESPKFLLEKGNFEGALDVCKTIYTINTGQSADSFPVKKIHLPENVGLKKKVLFRTKLFSAIQIFKPPYIGRLMIAFLIQFEVVSVVNLLRLWLPEIFTLIDKAQSLNVTENTLCPVLAAGHNAPQATTTNAVYYQLIIINASCVLGYLLFIGSVNFIGKKNTLMVIASISAVLTAFLPYVNVEYIFVIIAAITSTLFGAFYASTGMVVEVFPTIVRATSVSLTMLVGRIGVLSINFVVANFMYSYCEYIFYYLTALCISMVIASLMFSTTPIEAPNKNPMKASAA